MTADWQYNLNDGTVWAVQRDTDPYGNTRKVILDKDEVSVRFASNDRAPHVVAQVSAPIEVIAKALRKAGWTVTPPKETSDG